MIKVCDFGLSEDIYCKNYFREMRKSVKLPIKWMALESLLQRIFSEKSDVVSIHNTITSDLFQLQICCVATH